MHQSMSCPWLSHCHTFGQINVVMTSRHSHTNVLPSNRGGRGHNVIVSKVGSTLSTQMYKQLVSSEQTLCVTLLSTEIVKV